MGRKLLNFLFPASIYCISCGSIIDETREFSICDNCIEKFHWISTRTCQKCGKILLNRDAGNLCCDCKMIDHYFDKGYTCCQYGLYERNLLMDCKYGNKSYLAKRIGDIMSHRIIMEKLDIDTVIPVPLYKKRERKRGYNQATIMAKQVAIGINAELNTKVLKRHRETIPMKGLAIHERRENVKNVFSVFSAEKDKIKSKNILLIDDIYTTGATCDNCSKALKEAGAKKVYILTFAAGVSAAITNRV